MPAMKVSRSIEIDAPVEKIFKSISNFREWPQWSPWLITEPGCTVTYALDGKSYSWDGDYVGSGEMTVGKKVENKSLHYDLMFFRPWKSTAKTMFLFESKGDSTVVTWKMDSSMPFFLFFMKDMMEGLIGMDYDRGLAMFKDLMETGEIPVNLEFNETEAGPFTVVGLTSECAIADMGTSMEDDIKDLKQQIDNGAFKPCGPMISIYHKWDPAKGQATYTIGFIVDREPDVLPESYVVKEIPKIEAFTSKLTGPYRHIGNAWSAGIMRSQNGAFKKNRKIHPFEIYINNPEEVEENDLVTVVHFPKR